MIVAELIEQKKINKYFAALIIPIFNKVIIEDQQKKNKSLNEYI